MEGCAVRPASQAFGGFVLDRARGALRRPDGSEAVLRPKTFELLAHLAEQRGRVVSREALLAAVWPGVIVGDESLTQCVGEARRALGQDHAGLLRTMPKRGYLFEAPNPPPAVAARPAGGRHRLLAAAVAAVAVAGSGVALASFGVLRPPTPDPREEARRLNREARAWFDRDRSAAALLGQRAGLRKAVAADPTLVAAWVTLSFTHSDMVVRGHSLDAGADLRMAADAAERAVALAPGDPGALAATAAVLRLQPDRLEDAAAAFRRVVELQPMAHAARANLGWMLVLTGRAAEGEEQIRAALALAPADHSARRIWMYFHGMAELFLDQPGHGADALRQAAAGPGTAGNAGPALGLAAALALNGEREAAERLMGELRARRPSLSLAALRDDVLWHSRSAAFLVQRERLFRGLALAGLD
jgi:DNA-binding winged helix-turn-helix (wHTH) protein